jgi:hypothetical protein
VPDEDFIVDIGDKTLYARINGVRQTSELWNPLGMFLLPENDFLSICLLGGPGRPALKVGKVEHSFAAAYRHMEIRCGRPDPKNILVKTNDGMQYEATAAGAISLSSHKKGVIHKSSSDFLTGMDFLNELVFHARSHKNADVHVYWQFVDPGVVSRLQKLDVPYLSTPNVAWPGFFSSSYKVGYIERTKNDAMVDGWANVIEDDGAARLFLSWECKSRGDKLDKAAFIAILQRLRKAQNLHFVFTETMQTFYSLHEGEYQSLEKLIKSSRFFQLFKVAEKKKQEQPDQAAKRKYVEEVDEAKKGEDEEDLVELGVGEVDEEIEPVQPGVGEAGEAMDVDQSREATKAKASGSAQTKEVMKYAFKELGFYQVNENKIPYRFTTKPKNGYKRISAQNDPTRLVFFIITGTGKDTIDPATLENDS